MPKKNALPNARDQMWPLSKMPAEQDGFGRSSPAPLWPPATPTVHRTVIPCRLCTGFSNVNEKRTPEGALALAEREGFEPSCGFPQTDFEGR